MFNKDMLDNSNLLFKTLYELSEIGATEEKGITRLLFTEEWQRAQNYIQETMRDLGFLTKFDEVGNLSGIIKGYEDNSKTIMIGSHIDTVTNGGRLDGQFGIVAGICAVNYLKNKYGPPKKNLEVISLAEEEGSRFPFTFWGSKNVVSKVHENEVLALNDINGVSFTEAMENAGFTFKTEGTRDDTEAFIEIHIEQGGVLDIEKKEVGIVENIVGQKRYIVEIEGEANHAGTTPMKYRKDALLAASESIYNIITLAEKFGDPLVATIGKVDVYPNSTNVVPGKVVYSLDIRHIDEKLSNDFVKEINNILESIKKTKNVGVKLEQYTNQLPVPLDRKLTTLVENVCIENQIKYKRMNSGAGHDSQIFANYVPTALIFIPSINGISHNPLENTKDEDILQGFKVLTELIYRIAY